MRQKHEHRSTTPQHKLTYAVIPRWIVGFTVLALVVSGVLSGCGAATPAPTPTVQPTPTAEPTPTPGIAPPDYWPTGGWRTSTPEEQGVDSAQLLRALQHIEQAGINVRTLMVVRNGYVVLEAANQPYTLEMQYDLKSVTKSVIGALIGIAIDEGYIKDVKQPVLSFFLGRTIANRDKNKEAITIEDLLSMQPGLDCSDDKLNWAMEQSDDWIQFALDLPMASPPGEKLVYCTAGPHILSAVLTKATGMSTLEYARSRLFEPLGIAANDVTWGSDPQGITLGGYGISLTPRDMAKLGLLYLYDGKWEGKQVVPEEWVAASSTVHAIGGNDKNYGYLFWVYPTHFAAEGYGEQKIQVVKHRDLVVVMTAAIDWQDGRPLEELLQGYIVPAAKSDRPLPENASALADLQARIDYMANPVQPVPPLPETARAVSGQTYVLEDNPSGWKSLAITFDEGSPQARATLVNASGIVSAAVGLDNVYRVTKLPDGNIVGLRGRWEDENTFVVRQVQSSPDVEEIEMRFAYSGDDLNIHAAETVFGRYSVDMKGSVQRELEVNK